LETSNNINKFERNQIDNFVIKAADLGELKKVLIYNCYLILAFTSNIFKTGKGWGSGIVQGFAGIMLQQQKNTS